MEMTELLLEQKGINVNPIDAFELTPLKDAENHGLVEMVKLLRD